MIFGVDAGAEDQNYSRVDLPVVLQLTELIRSQYLIDLTTCSENAI